MDKADIIQQLMNMGKQNDVEIEAEILGTIVNISSFRLISGGSILQNVGELTQTAALVLDGICRSYYVDGEGNDITRGFCTQGTLCMDEGLFGYSESIVTWEALEDTALMCFDVRKMKELINEYAQLKSVYITLLERALRYKIYRENGFLVEDATQRYLHFRSLFPSICGSVKQHYIATYLGITPESLSRIRKALREN